VHFAVHFAIAWLAVRARVIHSSDCVPVSFTQVTNRAAFESKRTLNYPFITQTVRTPCILPNYFNNGDRPMFPSIQTQASCAPAAYGMHVPQHMN
jgi:hypothetical protein